LGDKNGGNLTGKKSSGVFEYAKSLGIALVLAFIIKTSIVEAYKIPSSSMEDTLLIGDFLLANKFVYGARIPFFGWRLPAIKDPQPGDVVIFKWPVDRKTNYIKRCIATEGQRVEIRDKVLYVDGVSYPNPEFSKFTERRIIPAASSQRDNYNGVTVPEGHIFVMGDNRDKSSDSRFWGTVPLDLVQGEALLIHWSWEPDRNAPEIKVSDLSSIPRSVFYNVLHFLRRVRWDRLGDIVS
jgi:signal peptidase I